MIYAVIYHFFQDGAVNNNNFFLFRDFLNVSDKIRATFFIEHEYCDYYNVEQLYVAGRRAIAIAYRIRKS